MEFVRYFDALLILFFGAALVASPAFLRLKKKKPFPYVIFTKTAPMVP